MLLGMYCTVQATQKCSSDMAVSAVECLSTMAINNEESSLLEYTTQWTVLVNRVCIYMYVKLVTIHSYLLVFLEHLGKGVSSLQW